MNLFLFQLQRHSDHHANPQRRYQILRDADEAPQLPAGYGAMMLLAIIPPLWRRVMDHRVIEHYRGDSSLVALRPPLDVE
jgi:alkane 1-monooxygenase